VITTAIETTIPDGFALDHAELPTPRICPPGLLSGEILVPPSGPQLQLALVHHRPLGPPLGARLTAPMTARGGAFWVYILALALLGASAGVLACLLIT
jgi:hypothetical protein